MTKRTVFVACGAAVLAVAGYLTSSAKKYAAATSAYYKTPANVFVTIFKITSGAVPHLTTVNSGSLNTAFFRTQSGGTQLTMFATKSTAKRIYYKP